MSVLRLSRIRPRPAAHDINSRGTIVGNVYGLSAPDYDRLRRIDPIPWTCAFGSLEAMVAG